MTNLFAYGTLLVPEIWRAVVGRDFPSEPAVLSGYEIRRVTGFDFPAIRPSDDPQSIVGGRVFSGLDAAALSRLDDYESDLYERIEVTLLGQASNPVRSQVYAVAEGQRHLFSEEVWTLDWFLAEALEGYLAGLQAALPTD